MLNKDVLQNIVFLKLDDEDLDNIRLTCRLFRDIVDSSIFWYMKTLKMLDLTYLEFKGDYKTYYKNIKNLITQHNDNHYYMSAIAQIEGYIDLLRILKNQSRLEIYIDKNKVYKYYIQPFSGKYEGKYLVLDRRGNIKESYMYKNGKFHGSYIKRNKKGFIKERGEYREGKKNGKFSFYDSQGEVCTEMNYKDDVVNGKYSLYINGVLYTEMNYLDGVLHGKYRTYYSENVIKEEGEYVRGIKY